MQQMYCECDNFLCYCGTDCLKKKTKNYVTVCTMSMSVSALVFCYHVYGTLSFTMTKKKACERENE